jgi:hypothetical protein
VISILLETKNQDILKEQTPTNRRLSANVTSGGLKLAQHSKRAGKSN